jgi:hypothetical protein
MRLIRQDTTTDTCLNFNKSNHEYDEKINDELKNEFLFSKMEVLHIRYTYVSKKRDCFPFFYDCDDHRL